MIHCYCLGGQVLQFMQVLLLTKLFIFFSFVVKVKDSFSIFWELLIYNPTLQLCYIHGVLVFFHEISDACPNSLGGNNLS